MDHIDTTEVIGAGHWPDEPHVLATWTASATETPIHINHDGVRGTLKPNTMTLMTANIAQMLIESGYDVTIDYDAIVNPGSDEAIEEAVAAVEAAAAKTKKAAKPAAVEAAATTSETEQTS